MKKNANIKYLGYGFLIGATLAVLASVALFLLLSSETAGAMILSKTNDAPEIVFTYTPAPASTESHMSIFAQTPTFTPTPTLTYLITPTASETPIPAATLTISEQKIKNGELHFTGVLTPEQQIRLYNTSITFIASNSEESQRIGEQITGNGYGSPTLICGPLSVAILQNSGLLTMNIIPMDFWLLNPFLGKDRAMINRVFPEDQYENYIIKTSINKINYTEFPLLPGDFIYLKHGSGGTFDHMLVVNRVDKDGRAYSVTNYYTEQGFIINEVLLYDPLDTNTGMFKQWTKKRNAPEGATGFGGFELWRLRRQ